MKEIDTLVNWLKDKDVYPFTPQLNSPHDIEVIVEGKKKLLFASNNYLGLMHDERVVDNAIEGVKKWGIGNGSARLLTGNLEIHSMLEKMIAEFKNREAGLTFVSGYMANSGSIPALVNIYKPTLSSLLKGKMNKDRECIIFSDEYNHASIVAGVKMSGAVKEIYKHVNVDNLENRLKKYPKKIRKLIITDSVFSMEGDIAPIPEILDLAAKYKADVYLDDAHGTGVLGKNGRGAEEYFNVEGRASIIMGTFTKSFGGVGGFVVSDRNLIEYLKISSDTFIFTAPIAPPVVYGLMKSIEIVIAEPWRREKLLENAKYLREQLVSNGFDIGNSKTQIIPIIIGKESRAKKISEKLFNEYDIFIPSARWPAVPHGSARLRVTVSCMHEKEHIDYLIKSLIEVL